MQNLVNEKVDKWVRPWDIERFDELQTRDERFFALVVKGLLEWLNTHLVMYGKPIRHFILNTGSTYMYLEHNGYEYTWCETTGENLIYMETPRCIVTIGSFSIPLEELTSPFSNGVFERVSTAEGSEGQIKSYNGSIQRLPIEIQVTLKYVFSNFNESIIFIQEILERVSFQQYFNIVYLGQVVKSSLEFDSDFEVQLSELDMASPDPSKRTMDITLKVCTVLPVVNETSVANNTLIMNSIASKLSEIGINGRDKYNGKWYTPDSEMPRKNMYGGELDETSISANTGKPSGPMAEESNIYVTSTNEHLGTYKKRE